MFSRRRFSSISRFLPPVFLLVCLLFAASGITAQELLPLTQTASVAQDDGLTLSINYPEAWELLEVEGSYIYLAESEVGVTAISSNQAEMPEGEVGVTLATPAFMDLLELPRDADPEDAVSAFLQALNAEGEVQDSPAFAVPVAYAIATSADSAQPSLFIAAFAFPEGTVMFGASPSDNVNDTVFAMMATIALSSGSTTATDLANDIAVEVDTPLGPMMLSFTLPEGWVYDDGRVDSGVVDIANSEEALAKSSTVDLTLDEGEIIINIALPRLLEQLGVDTSAAPDAEAAISGMLTAMSARGRVLSDDSFSVPAAFVTMTGANLPDGSADAYGLAFESGAVVVVVLPSGTFDDETMALIRSVEFGAGDVTEAPTAPPKAEAIRQWASAVSGSSQYGTTSWSFEQAVGEPNTPQCGDASTAWASSKNNGRDFLVVEFEQAVIPTQINIHQTYTPGSIVQIDVGHTSNRDRVLPLPDSADPPGNTDCPGVFSYEVSGVDVPIDFVVIYLDQSIGGNWNEIDAVELVGTPAE